MKDYKKPHIYPLLKFPSPKLITIYWSVVTLCEGWGTPRMGDLLNKDLVLTIVPQVVSNVN
jgi:hypothetical protein